MLYLGRAPRTKETLLDSRERCRVTRHSRVFRGLTGSQRTPGIWGVTFPLTFAITEGKNIDSWGWFLACIRNRVTQWLGICVISDRHPGIMAAMSNPHLGWAAPFAYHKICMRHLANNFMIHFKDKLLKTLVCRVALASTQRKFNKHVDIIWRIISESQQ